MQFRPDEAGGDVGGGVLPDRSLGAREPAHEEAIELHLLTGLFGLDMALRRREIGLSLIRLRVAGDERQALGTGVQVEAPQDPPDAVLRGDPPRPEPRPGQGEGDDPLLEMGADLVGHPRAAALPDPQSLHAPAVDLALPAVVGRALDPHRPAGGRDVAELLRQGEAAQAESEQHVILSHRVLLVRFSIWPSRSVRSRADAPGPAGPGASTPPRSEVLRELGVSPSPRPRAETPPGRA